MFRINIIKRIFTTTNYQLQTNINVIQKTDKSSFITLRSDKYHDDDDDNDNLYENMFVYTNFQNIEWGGPLRGGTLPEPTRYGDWERKGRCSDY